MNARPPLFRKEAAPLVQAGRPIGIAPVSWSAVAAIIAATVALAIGFSAFTSLARKETLSGYLMPAGGAVRVPAPRGGIIGRVAVAPGQVVKAGDPLFLISSPGELADGGSLAAAQAASVERQIAALSAELGAERNKAGLDTGEARMRLAGLREEAVSLAQQRQAQAERIAATEARLRALAPVRAKGFIPEDEFRNREEYLLSLRQGLSGIDRQLAENRRAQGEAEVAARAAPAALAGRAAQLRSELAALERRRAEASAEGSQLVRAPVGGRIVALRAEPGRAIGAGTPLVSIAPGDPRLKAVLLAPQNLVGLIEPGQKVRLMFEALPMGRFGSAEGVVTSVSAVALPAEEAGGPARYRVDVALRRQSLGPGGAEVPLAPDMSLKGDIVLEERSLLEWLFQPLLAAKARSEG
ncbi:MAG TPA: HlyD family efflux transporter periplasmic adaptor subunit [Allosphingosinicella sp.]|nr:HlyD family efflux transporter periplasmic adaptor subunit [Allosphingosinicella sp.]